jgi:replicative DNA helicase
VPTNLELTPAFQRAILSRCLNDEAFLSEAGKAVCPEHFDTKPLQWICKKMLDGANRPSIILDILKQDKKSGQISDVMYEGVIDDLKHIVRKKDFDEARHGLEKVKDFVIAQSMINGFSDAAVAIEKGIKKPTDILRDIKQRLNFPFDENKSETVNIVTGVGGRFKKRDDMVKSGELVFVPFGLSDLDREIKGPRPGQVFGFFGDTNVGKSALAVHISVSCFFRNFRTWHVSIEDNIEVTEQRYDAAMTGISYDSFTYCEYTKEEKEKIVKIFQLLNEKRKQNIYLSKIEDGCCMADIEEEFEKNKSVNNFTPNVILIDSPHCMVPSVLQEDNRLNAKQTYLDIRKFARKNKIAMYVFDQKAKIEKDKISDQGGVSESYDKARILDGLITINQNRMLKKEGMLNFYIAKMKDRKKGVSFLVKPEYKYMRFQSIGEDNSDD